MTAVEEHDTTKELESLHELLDQQQRSREKQAAKAPRGFDPAAVFLLDLGWENLFEQVDRDGLLWRCKGCGLELRFTQREKHHGAHKRAARVKPVWRPYPDTGTNEKGAVGSMATAAQKQDPGEKVSKTQLARETAVAVLVKAAKPMKMDEIVAKVLADAKVKAAGVSQGTVSTQVSREMAEKQPRIQRVEKGVYQAKAAKAPKAAPKAKAVAAAK